MAQWGEEQQVHGDPEQAAILASYNAQRFRRLDDEQLEYINNANYEHAVKISHQRAATEKAGRLLMAAERPKLLELNAQRQAEVAAREQARPAHNEEFRRWLAALRGQHRRQAPTSPTAMLYRQMREARAKRWACLQAAKRKNNDEAGPSRTPTDASRLGFNLV
jgi:hypothetical protein